MSRWREIARRPAVPVAADTFSPPNGTGAMVRRPGTCMANHMSMHVMADTTGKRQP